MSRISTSDKTDVAVQKARKLIQSDKVDFLIGNVNSSHAIAIAQVAAELKVLHIVPGGHADAVTGTQLPLDHLPHLQHRRDAGQRHGGPADQQDRQEDTT